MCKKEFRGVRCEKSVLCEAYPCGLGNCSINKDGLPFCTCPQDRDGTNCDREIKPGLKKLTSI
ncbi:hypothetical protein MXB_5133 [Myxobolus squamalis]|nr:hypothetical protein MXB_5133 [Myxobolus squamalis]